MSGAGPAGAQATVSVSRRTLLHYALGATAVLNVVNALNIVLIDGSHWLLMAVERNPSTWFGSALLAVTALLAWGIGKTVDEPAGWSLVAGVLLLMSVDEVATFHERLGHLPAVPHLGPRAWVGGGLVVAVLIAIRLLPWVLRLPWTLRVVFLQSAALFLAGSVGVESLAGAWHESHGDDRMFFVISTVEENLELAGVLLLADRLLAYAASLRGGVRLELVDPARRDRLADRRA